MKEKVITTMNSKQRYLMVIIVMKRDVYCSYCYYIVNI